MSKVGITTLVNVSFKRVSCNISDALSCKNFPLYFGPGKNGLQNLQIF